MMINGEAYGRLTPEAISKIINEIRRQEKSPVTAG